MADYGEMFYGTLPQDTQDMDAVLRGVGRSLREIGRSTQYLPYDVLGAPVDLATMAMRPLGYDVAQPVGGSDWLIEMSRRMGIADQPTGSGLETATRFATGVPSPVAVPRALAGIGRFVDMLGDTPPTGAVTLGSKAEELNALKVRLDELNNQFATDTAPPSAVREHGAVMKRYQELQDELYPRPQTTSEVQEPDLPQGLLPEQGVQEISKAVAQRGVVQTDSFKGWFGDWQADPAMASKVVDESGLPKIVFHGTQRPDRIGTQFRKSRATSGPMSFFTDDPEIASGYATGKRDTSLAYEDTDYANWFKKKEGRSRLNLDQVGARMSSQERQDVLDKLRRVGQDEQGNIVIGEPLVSDQTFDFMLRDPREAGGNPLRLANKLWLESGTLYGREEDFSKVLKAIGVKGFEEDFPTSTYPAVYPVYLDIKNPLNTMRIDEGTLSALESAASRQRKPRAMGGADQWDKRMRDPQEWISQLKADMAEGKNSMVWTSIPDWVTNTLKKRGFDGIEDVGGKSFGTPHTVWIPFEENQIKSATGNVGTFSGESKNILKSAAPVVSGGLLGAGMMQEEETY